MDIKGYLKNFSGTYNTLWEPDFHIDNILDECQVNEKYHSILLNNIYCNFDNTKYLEAIGKFYSNEIEAELKRLGFNVSIEFESTYSPQYYNYSNDQINVIYKTTQEQLDKILVYLKEHNKEFSEYLKENFTSRSGFMSFYDNTIETWLNIDDWKQDDNMLSCIIEFIINNENEDIEFSIYDRFICNHGIIDYIDIKEYINDINKELQQINEPLITELDDLYNR